jgi:hypothetical protein
MKLGFSGQIFEKILILDLMKVLPVVTVLFHTGRQTDRDRTKLIVAFRNFSNAPKNANFGVIPGGTCINH